jgi:hypothetical protein
MFGKLSTSIGDADGKQVAVGEFTMGFCAMDAPSSAGFETHCIVQSRLQKPPLYDGRATHEGESSIIQAEE